ncbi:cytochrome c [Corallococcus sp. AB049A]|uniref:Cytochrome c n=2 Tax=Myxococcaceae TaxID=31 RepID=A0A3A8QAD7_9BACT|nr:cytochrome c [Corallococcus sp. AB050B]RKH65643.1 cytochrome c [Corallococcus interemptor]RKI53938.1 cytochrome c [Corallococcus sp. AB049A]
MAITGGDVERGKEALRHYGCGGCHVIPGVPGATGQVGPSLEGIALRTYLAGRLQNAPENMVRWVQHPQSIEPGNAMPELGVKDGDARDIAAYLYTLR